MKKVFPWMLIFVVVGPFGIVQATGWRKNNDELKLLNQRLHGKIIDHTANHGTDNRIWARTLGQRRDMYVYLPPGFDPRQSYPIILYLHSFAHDEQEFLEVATWLDKAIHEGDLPPLIVAAPDGSVTGEPSYKSPPTFFLNTNLGDFEDYLLCDVWDFITSHYPIRPEREAHILAGASMGGFAAYNIGIRYRNCFGIVIGLFPPLNLRWMDECGDYWAKFDPQHWGWRNSFDRRREVMGKFGYATVRVDQLVDPLFDSKEQAIVRVSLNNPIELIDRTHLRNGELQMYVAYGANDEFNLGAQIESFLYICKCRNIYLEVGFDPDGHHDLRTAYRLFPGVVRWLGPRLAQYNIPGTTQVCTVREQPERKPLYSGNAQLRNPPADGRTTMQNVSTIVGRIGDPVNTQLPAIYWPNASRRGDPAYAQPGVVSSPVMNWPGNPSSARPAVVGSSQDQNLPPFANQSDNPAQPTANRQDRPLTPTPTLPRMQPDLRPNPLDLGPLAPPPVPLGPYDNRMPADLPAPPPSAIAPGGTSLTPWGQ